MLCASASTAHWGVVGLHEPVLAFHDPALRIGEVLLGFGIRHAGRRGGLPSAFAATLGLTLACRLVLRLELGFGCRLRLRLQFGLGLACLLVARLLVGDPIRHLIAVLCAAVPVVPFCFRC